MPFYETLELLDDLLEPAGFAYDPARNIFYARMNGWQRKVGYCRTYDEAAAHFSMIIHCEPFYFFYDNREWLLEFWKGQYGMTTGGEIGLYYREVKDYFPEVPRNLAIYQAAEEQDFPRITMRLVKKDRELFQKGQRHWWLTGFILGEFSKPKQLVMETELIFRDTVMAQAAAGAIRMAGYDTTQVRLLGRKVFFRFDKPRTRQPFGQKKVFTLLTQLRNYLLCKKYRRLTRGVREPLEQVAVFQKKAPRVFQYLYRLGKNRQGKKKRNGFTKKGGNRFA